MQIQTKRLTLVSATPETARAELNDRREFARMLAAVVPDDWPPETAADVLPLFLEWMEAAPDAEGWFSWYALARDQDIEWPVLVGGGGFKGAPRDGTVEIGYAVIPQFRGRGYATEMVRALVKWAFQQPGVTRVIAETEGLNPASERVLARVNFDVVGEPAESGGRRFERCKR
jgi:[ribosomal protein S5]-alanine N-acetyltransferase